MAKTDTAFVGQIPELYERLMVPMLFRPFAADMARRLASLASGHILETAAGTGVVARALAAALPASVAITATDLNQPMLDHAAAQRGAERIEWRQADAQGLPFPDQSFDAVVCQFGVMFFPDKPRACAEALRVLKPGGRFIFSVWSTLETSPIPATVHATVAAMFPADPPAFFARTPHGHADIPGMTSTLTAAGFTRIAAERRTERCCAASALAAATALCQGTPLRGEILARDATALDRVTHACAAALTAQFGHGVIEAPMEAIILSATRPG